MSDVVYRPGAWQVVVEESGVAALPADASADKVVALSAMLRRGLPELTEVIDVLSGGAITGLGSFAVALIGPGGTRFAVRGAVTVSTGPQAGFSGEDITTWSERFIPEAPRFEIGFGDAAEDVEYPIRSGVVLAAGVRVGAPFAPADDDTADDEAAQGSGVVALTDAEPEAGAQTSAEPEAGAQTDAGPESDAEPEPEAAADEEAPTETITPDEVALARGSAADEPWADPTSAADLAATIIPPVHGEDAAPSASGSQVSASEAEADAFAVVPPMPPAPPVPPMPTVSGLDIGDHDGATISLAEARRLRAAAPGPDAPTEVLPVLAAEAPAAGAARIRLSTGQVVDLDRSVIIGRKPRSTRASGSTLPHLIAVDSPESDISRNHLEVRPEGDSVVVVDLHTTNGSTLLRPGADPVRLHPGEPTLVLDGDVIDVGDGVTVAIEELR